MRQASEAGIRIGRDERPGGAVVTLTIDRPAKLNALNRLLMRQLVEALGAVSREAAVRAVVLAGAGPRAFVGGADIAEMAALADADEARGFITLVHQCCDAVRAVPVPTLARLHGFTFGAGMELAAACDLRVASDEAVFGMPEVQLGIPSVVEAALLPMLVGWGRTRQILMLGGRFDAHTALEWGFVERVVPAAELDSALGGWIEQVLACPPEAVRLQKQLIRAWEDLPLRAAVAAGIDSFAAAFRTGEPGVAMRAFMDAQASRKAGQAIDGA